MITSVSATSIECGILRACDYALYFRSAYRHPDIVRANRVIMRIRQA